MNSRPRFSFGEDATFSSPSSQKISAPSFTIARDMSLKLPNAYVRSVSFWIFIGRANWTFEIDVAQ